MRELYLEMLEEAYFEVKLAFDGLADGHLWKRPGIGLLSIGEMAGHMAYWEAVKLVGEGWESETAKTRLQSPLIDPRFRYYPMPDALPLPPELLSLSAPQVCAELLRVHQEAVADFRSRTPDLDSVPPGCPPEFTYRAFLSYAPIHVAYHTGQIYSARHLLGDTTPDN